VRARELQRDRIVRSELIGSTHLQVRTEHSSVLRGLCFYVRDPASVFHSGGRKSVDCCKTLAGSQMPHCAQGHILWGQRFAKLRDHEGHSATGFSRLRRAKVLPTQTTCIQLFERLGSVPVCPSIKIPPMQKKIFWMVFMLLGLLADFMLPFWWACVATIPILFAAWWIAYRSDWF